MKGIKNLANWLNNSPYLLILFAPLFWGGNIVLGRGVHDIIPPVTLAFWRWLVALLILIPFTHKSVKNDWVKIKANWKILALLAFFGVTCFNTLLYKAVHTTTAINGSLVQTSMPAWIVLFSLILFKDLIRWVQAAGVFLCIFGAFLIIVRGDWNVLSQMILVEGDILMIIAVILYALYSALLRFRPDIADSSLLTATFALGCALLLPVYLWELITIGAPEFGWKVVLSVGYVAVFPSILAYLCWNRGVELVGPNTTGLYINFIPVFASLFAILLLGESLHLFHFVGIILIIFGMLLFNNILFKK